MSISFRESDTDQVGCLLLHGLTGSPEVLYELGNHLTQLKIKVSIPLLPGHGSNLRSLKNTSWEAWYQTVENAYLDLGKSCKTIFVIGFSMGGALSLLLASNYCPYALITLAAPIKLNSALKYILPIAKYILPYWKKSWQPYYRKQRHDNNTSYPAYPLAAVQELDELLRKTRNCLSKLTCPILLFHGFGDQRVSFHNASIINSSVSSLDKRMIFIDENRHTLTQGKHAPEVYRAITEFILEQLKLKNRRNA